MFERYGVKITSDQIARAYGNEFRMSWKKAVEVGSFIKYMTIKQAEQWLEDVVKLKRPVPIRRFKKKQAHHATPWEGWAVAKWPAKVARSYLEVVRNLENNARFRGLDVDRVVLVHVAAHKGMTIRNYMQRAFGRSTPWNEQTVNIEIIGVELPREVLPKKLKLKIFK
ncbi:MAG: 50S ribosomal protein L22 [Thermoproteus sp.]|nr:50S ribosomal protein L22 [Thermoproteus sp.]